MMAARSHLVLLSSLGVLLVAGCDEEGPFPFPDEESTLRTLPHLGQPVADPTNRFLGNPAAQALGEQLFADPALSSCGTVSCQSCHLPDQGFSYGLSPGAPGCDGNQTGRNPPTLLNVAHARWFMWDGRADRLWSQAVLPYLSPAEMAGSPALLRERLGADPYATPYTELFGQAAGLDSDDQLLANFGKALAAFEWTLARTTSPFDEQLTDYLAAVGAGTQEDHPLHLGLKTFVRKGGCAVCHKGATLSDELFHNVGLRDDSPGRAGRLAGIPQVLESVFNALGAYSDQPAGNDAAARIVNLQLFSDSAAQRAEAEALGQLEGAFKTPSLRNVALTAPYMHNGSINTLAEVVEFYNRGGDPADTFAGTRATTIKPLELTEAEKAALVSLLELMTGAQAP